ncbi:MAG TPA: 3-phosphoshikimate 1-carboxyvinyltransferase [Streptosporangiaceae bacterium]|nr:3-phosphoshikimate 1-carboxyvinyltransferase [Streptosporangiaceae bacterium]
MHARLELPGSKSITNRALILAALGDTPTQITGPLRARDTELMAAAISALGAAVAPAGGGWLVTPGWQDSPVTVDVGNAGTVLRFVPPVAALARADVQFRGDPRASRRPVGPLLAALHQLGVQISDDGRQAVPFTVRGQGRVPGGTVSLDASGSSQLVSGLLLAAPRYDKGAEIRHEGPRIPSAPHIAMTVAMLRGAGASIETATPRGGGSVADVWRVHPGVLSPGTIDVEPDLSNAAPFLAAAMVTGGQVTIAGWPAQSLQAADEILDTLARMGATAAPAAGGMRVTGSGKIHGITADLRDVSELTPVLVALATMADSPSTFTGIGHMRTHESDRLAALASEIGALGGDVTELADGLHVRPRPLRADGAVFDSHDDHRLVMAAAVLGLAVPGMQVRNAATVGKTFPGFGELWRQMLEQAPQEQAPQERAH